MPFGYFVLKSLSVVCALSLILSFPLRAQEFDFDYFFEGLEVREDFPTPDQIMGFSPGDWHPNHSQVEHFLTFLADNSDRIVKKEMGRSHENRPISALVISTPNNHDRLEELRECHLASIDSGAYSCEEGAFNPLVLYQAYTSHGNEPSGTGAALLYAWYLAAAPDAVAAELLDSTIIILDACMNPDGYDRFVSWVNSRRSVYSQVVDPADDEFNEPWPRSRTNHYWFDLNRDWLPVQHPESVGKIRMFQKWKPNVLTDHHEMGSNATYFFQPGVPSRTNPMTPEINQELTAAIGEFHAAALDDLRVPYYTKERFDDYYYGKGSTYPDIQGCVGILFEQASSRGHVQQTIHGKLTFAETIRNQLITSFSTLEAALELKKELQDYQSEFFREAVAEAKNQSFDGYRIEAGSDPYRAYQLVKMMLTHNIEVHKGIENDREFYYIPLGQPRYSLVRTIFETVDEFPDSLFYDVSTWTMSMAFGLEAIEVGQSEVEEFLEKPLTFDHYRFEGCFEEIPLSEVGYVFRWNDFLAPSLLYHLQEKGIKAKVAFAPFSVKTVGGDKNFGYGSILILPGIQSVDGGELHRILTDLSSRVGLRIHAVESGLSLSGIDLGSPSFRMVDQPKILMVTGEGVNSNKAGEIWYYFDRHLGIPVTRVRTGRLGGIRLSDYNVVIIPSLRDFPGGSSFGGELNNFLRDGNTLIVEGSASRWASRNNLSRVEHSGLESRPDTVRSYSEIAAAYGALSVGGSILRARADLTHPLFFGYENEEFFVFKRKRWTISSPANHLAAPLRYTDDPLASGYLHKRHLEPLKNAPSIAVGSLGRGRVIHLSDGTFFRGYWYGTAHILANAVFFGNSIHGRATY